MIEFNRRTPRFAACGLAAVAIIGTGLAVSGGSPSTDSEPVVTSNSVDGSPAATSTCDVLVAVASVPWSDHITHEHVANVLQQHGLLKDWMCPCSLGTEPFSMACVRQRDKQRAVALLNESFRGVPFRGYAGSVEGRMTDAPWKSLATNVTYEELLKLPEFAPTTPAGKEIRKRGNVSEDYSFGLESHPVALRHITCVSRLDRKYFGKRGWETATEYRIEFASARQNARMTQRVQVQVFNGGKSAEWDVLFEASTLRTGFGDPDALRGVNATERNSEQGEARVVALSVAGYAVKTAFQFSPFSPMFWLEMQQGFRCGFVIPSCQLGPNPLAPRKLIFDADAFRKIEGH